MYEDNDIFQAFFSYVMEFIKRKSAYYNVWRLSESLHLKRNPHLAVVTEIYSVCGHIHKYYLIHSILTYIIIFKYEKITITQCRTLLLQKDTHEADE